MKVIVKNKSDCLKILSIFLIALGSTQAFANKLNDQDLAEQSVGVIKLAPIVIHAVKKDVQQPIDEQNELHDKVAQQRYDEAKKELIYSTVLTDYEWQKKDGDSNKPNDKYLKPYQKYQIYEMGYNPYQRHDVRITTDDRVTIYIGHEVDGVGFVR